MKCVITPGAIGCNRQQAQEKKTAEKQQAQEKKTEKRLRTLECREAARLRKECREAEKREPLDAETIRLTAAVASGTSVQSNGFRSMTPVEARMVAQVDLHVH